MNGVPLPEGYYLANFLDVLGDVEARYSDLLLGEEREVLRRFRGLSTAAQRLYVRLLTRRGPWFRREGLQYAEIGDPEPVIGELLASGFCHGEAGLPEMLPLLQRADLLQALTERGLRAPRGARREALLRTLVAEVEAEPLRASLAARLRPVKPIGEELWRRIFLLFFGNFEQDLATFVLADSGRIRYELYAVDPRLRSFGTRPDVDFLLSLRELRERLERIADRDELDALTTTALAMEARPGIRPQRRYQRLLNDLGLAWERARDPDRALACYARSARPPARERRTRILARRGDRETACRLALEMAEAPRDEGEARFAAAFLERQRRQVSWVDAWLQAHPPPAPPDQEDLSIGPHPEGVERGALAAARAEGWDGFFAENHLWRACFGLALWEELFTAVPGAFLHRFQDAPLDLGSDEFYRQRQAAIEARLAALRACPDPSQPLLAMAVRKRGVANTFLDWRRLDLDELAAALPRIGGAVLGAVLGILVRNPRAFASGFPDLFLFRPGAPDWKLWEVKGPGDTLRPEQDAWLRRFRAWGCDARVVRVRYREC